MKAERKAQPAGRRRAGGGAVGAAGGNSANHFYDNTKTVSCQMASGESFRVAMPQHIGNIKLAEMARNIKKCPKCGGTGEFQNGAFCDACEYGRNKAQMQARWFEKNEADIEAARRRRMEKLYGPCAEVPERYQGLTPQTLEALGPGAVQGKRAAIEAATRWAKGEEISLDCCYTVGLVRESLSWAGGPSLNAVGGCG